MSTYNVDNLLSTSIVDENDKTKAVRFDLSNISSETERLITIPDQNFEMVGDTTNQVLENKIIDGTKNTLLNIGNPILLFGIDASKIADGSVSNAEYQRIGGLTSNAVGETDVQTVSNKTFVDSSTTFVDNVNSTKKGQFNLSNVSTGTTRQYDLPNADTRLVGHNNTETLTSKTMSALSNTFTDFGDAEIKVLAGINATKIADGSVNNTKFQYLASLTSNPQTQINNRIPYSEDNLICVQNGEAGSPDHIQFCVTKKTLSDTYNLAIDADDPCKIIFSAEDGEFRQATVLCSDGTGKATTFGVAGSSDGGKIWYPILVAKQNQRVGIGNNNPSETLDVTGNIAVSGTVDGRDVAADGNTLDSHVGSTSNPHSVTKAQIGLSNVPNLKMNLVAITAPSVTDDTSDGYSVGSRWINTATNEEYVCTDNSVGAANWENTTDTGGISGETNTASNVGTSGVGVFKQKAGTDLQFKKISTKSSRITVEDDVANDEVDLDVVEANINIQNLSGAPSGTVVGTTDNQTLSNKTLGSNLDANSNKVTNLSEPTDDSDAATKRYVDNMAQGLDQKESVRVKTVTSLPSYTKSGTGEGATLTATSNGALPAIDGVTLDQSDRVLVTTEGTTDNSDNGIYVVTAVGDVDAPWVLTRATDADTNSKVTAGLYVFVTEGSTCADCSYTLVTDDPIVVDTTDLTFSQFSSAGQIQGGAGLTKTGQTLNVGGSSTIIAYADTLAVNSSSTANQVLLSSGTVGNTATYGAVPLNNSNSVTGTLPVSRGGTGAMSLTSGRFVQSNGTNAFTATKSIPSGTVVGTSDSQTLTNKVINASNNTISNITDSEIKLLAGINAAKIANGSVSNTEFQHLSNVTSDIQTQFDSMVRLLGRSGGQVVYGGTSASENLNLHSTTNATKGDIVLHDPTVTKNNIIVNDQGYATTYVTSLQSDQTSTWLEILNNGGTNKGVFFGIQNNDFELWSYQGGDIKYYVHPTASNGAVKFTMQNNGVFRIHDLATGILKANALGQISSETANTAFNKDFGTTSGTVAEGDHTHTPSEVGLSNVPNLKVNLAGASAPDADNDSSEGYAVGSMWVDTINHEVYTCTDASVGAANWLNTSGLVLAQNIGSGIGVYSGVDGDTMNFRSISANTPLSLIASDLKNVFEFEDDVTDTIGGENGTITGGVTYATGKVGTKCADFDGATTTRVDVGTLDVNPSEFSISMWFNATSFSDARLISKATGTNVNDHYFMLGCEQSGVSFRLSTNSAGTGTEISGSTNLSTGVWYHIVGWYNGSVYKIYLNGEEDASGSKTGLVPTSDSVDTTIGNQPLSGGGNRAFHGKIDQLMIWNRAVTSQEISALYNGGSGRPTSYFTDASISINLDPGEININTLQAAPIGMVVGTSDVQALTNKVINANSNTITNISNSSIKSGAAIDATKIANGSVSNTEFQHLSNVTSDIQAQIDNHTHVPSEVGLGNVPNLLMNLSATSGPSANDDSTVGYAVGSRWVDTTNNEEYVCTNNSVGAANWKNTTDTGEAGESNTASNVGTSGVGVFKQKAGTDLQFKKISTKSSRITVEDDVANDEVDLDVVESNINIQNLSGAPSGTVVGNTDSQTLTNKVINADSNTITNIDNADIKSGAAIDATKIGRGTVNNINFSYLSNVTSDIQAQIDTHTHTPSEVGLSNVPNLKINLGATTDPTVSDDSSAGYSIGSRWVNTSTANEFVCLEDGVGAAVWKTTTSVGGGGGGSDQYDAIVDITGNGDYTSIVAAFNAGHQSVYVRKGTYVETANIVIPNHGALIGEALGLTNIVFSGAFSVKVDGSGGTKLTAGTISASTDSATVTGSGTTFTSLSSGDFILINDSFFEIDSIVSNTSLTLTSAFRGESVSGISYQAQTMKSDIAIRSLTIMSSSGTGLYVRAARHMVVDSINIISCNVNLQMIDSGSVSLNIISSYNSTSYGMHFTNIYTCTISSCEVYNSNSTGLYFDGDSDRILMTNMISTNNDGDGINFYGNVRGVNMIAGQVTNNDAKGINTETSTGSIVINNCTLKGNGTDGIDFDGDNNMVTNCVIKENGQYGIQAGDTSVINNNQIESNGSHGINMDGDHKSTITGNRIIFNTGCGIWSNSDYCSMVGNYIEGNSQQGIYLTTATDCAVTGNVIFNNSSQGIYLVTAPRTVVSSNRVYSNTVGIQLNSASNDSIITGNIVDSNSSDGIQIAGDNCIVTNNRCVSNGGDGLQIDSTANNVIYNNNLFTGNTGSDVNDSGTVDSNLPPVLANEIDGRSATTLKVGATKPTKIEVAKSGVTTELKGPLVGLEGANITGSIVVTGLVDGRDVGDDGNTLDTHIGDSANPHSVTKAQIGLSEVQNLKVNLSATTVPGTTDDSSAGYSVGSRWINTSTNEEYVCTDNSVNSANWENTTDTGGGGGSSTLEDLTDTTITTPGKGSLIVHNGNYWIDRDAGTDGQILVFDSGDPSGISFADLNSSTVLLSAYANTSETISGYNTTIDIDTIIKNTGEFNINNGEVTVNYSGNFVITYDVTADKTGYTWSDAAMMTWLESDSGSGFNEVTGTRSTIGAFSSGTQPQSSTSTIIMAVTTGMKFRIRSTRYVGSNNMVTISQGSRLTLFCVDNTAVVVDGGDGDTNASNVGTSGIGLFKQKTGSDLQFKKINAKSSRITVEDDIANDEVDLDVVESNINIQNLSGAPSGTVVGNTDSQTLTNKVINANSNTITNISNSSIKSGAAIDATKIANGSVSNTEFQYLSNVTSDIQTQINTHTHTPSEVGLGNVPNLKMNLVATTDPSSSDDSNDGYAVGSRWVNTSTDEEYVCTDASVGAANWENTTASGAATLADLTDTTITTPAKGSILTHNGSSWIDKDVGTNGQILVADSGQTAGVRWDDFGQSKIGFNAYDNAGGATYSSNTITVGLDTVRKNTGEFSLVSDVVTVNYTGVFIITYDVSTDISSGSSRSVSIAWLELDNGLGFTEIDGTRGFMYNRTVGNAAQSCSRTLMLDVTSGDKFRIRATRYTGNDTMLTIPDGSGITFIAVPGNGLDGAQGPEGPAGPAGSGVNINVYTDGTPVNGSPFEILNFTGGTAAQNGRNPSQVDISPGLPWYGASATDPTGSFSGGEMYFNTAIGQMMFYDSTRSKWLSVTLCFEGGGLNGTTGPGTFYRRFNGMSMDLTTGPYVPKGTIVAMGYGTDNAAQHDAEVYINGVMVASLNSGGATTAYDDTINVDINGGKYSLRNSPSSASSTSNFQGTVWYRLRA